MYKVVGLLVRKEGLTDEEFRERWDDHVAVARELPNVQKYTRSVPVDPERAPYDGVAEMYFESPDACREAFDSEAGDRQFEDAARFVRMPDAANPTAAAKRQLLGTMVEVGTELDETG